MFRIFRRMFRGRDLAAAFLPFDGGGLRWGCGIKKLNHEVHEVHEERWIPGSSPGMTDFFVNEYAGIFLFKLQFYRPPSRHARA